MYHHFLLNNNTKSLVNKKSIGGFYSIDNIEDYLGPTLYPHLTHYNQLLLPKKESKTKSKTK